MKLLFSSFLLFAAVFILQSSLRAMPPKKIRGEEPKPVQEHFCRGSGRGDDADGTAEDAPAAEEERAASSSQLMEKEQKSAASEKGKPTNSAPDDLMAQLAQIENHLSETRAEITTATSEFDLEVLSKRKLDLEQAQQWLLSALQHCDTDSQLSEYYQLGVQFLLAKIEALKKQEGEEVVKSCEEAIEATRAAIQYHDGNKKLAGAFKDLALLFRTSVQKLEVAQPPMGLLKKEANVRQGVERERSPFERLQAAREHLNYIGSLCRMNREQKITHLTSASYCMLAAKAIIDWEKDRRDVVRNCAWCKDLMFCYHKTVGFLESAIRNEAEQVKLQEDRQARNTALSQVVTCNYAMSLSYLRSIEVLKEENDLKRKQFFLEEHEKARSFFESALSTTMNGMSFESQISCQKAQQLALGQDQMQQLNSMATGLRDLQLEQGKKLYDVGMEMLQGVKKSFDEGKVDSDKS